MAGVPGGERPIVRDMRDLAAAIDRALPVLAELTIAAGAIGLLVALLLPWYDVVAIAPDSGVPSPDPVGERPSGWESFRTADILLAANAAVALGAIVAARVLHYRAVYAAAGLLSWFAVALILYSFYRPANGVAGPPAEGYLVALCAAGTISGGSLLALIERRRTTVT